MILIKISTITLKQYHSETIYYLVLNLKKHYNAMNDVLAGVILDIRKLISYMPNIHMYVNRQ